jgi:hypothetical protein
LLYTGSQFKGPVVKDCSMNISTKIWDREQLNRPNAPEQHTKEDKHPIYALYVFASDTDKQNIRAGAIGVHRTFDVTSGAFSTGNSASKRFGQCNAPADKR